MARLNSSVTSWPVVIFCLAWLALFTGAQLWPASWWFEVRSVQVSNGPYPPILAVERNIKRPFVADWVVTIRKWGGGWNVVCNASGKNAYKPDAQLPQKLTLAWWTNGACANLEPGRYSMSTVWTIRGSGIIPDHEVRAESNIWELTR